MYSRSTAFSEFADMMMFVMPFSARAREGIEHALRRDFG